MKEAKEIVKAWDLAHTLGKRAALATLVHLDGSSYRRPGARMLVTEDGEVTGAISGGCLEGDALRKSMLAIAQQEARLVTYDTSNEEDMSIGVQLGCAGIIQVLFEPIDADRPHNPIELLRTAVTDRRNAVLVTLFSLDDKRGHQPGTCLLIAADNKISGDVPIAELQKAITSDATEALQSEQSSFWH